MQMIKLLISNLVWKEFIENKHGDVYFYPIWSWADIEKKSAIN